MRKLEFTTLLRRVAEALGRRLRHDAVNDSGNARRTTTPSFAASCVAGDADPVNEYEGVLAAVPRRGNAPGRWD